MNAEMITLEAHLRIKGSKGEIKKQRLQGIIPGILYSKNKSILLSINKANLPSKHTHAQMIKLKLDDNTERFVIMREVQVNPLNDQAIHFDFQEISENDMVCLHIPLNFIGLTREQEKEGAFNIRARYLLIKANFSKLPQTIDVDVSKLKTGESVTLFDLNLAKELFVKTGKGKNVALASLVKI